MPTIYEHVKNCSFSAADTEQLDTGAHYTTFWWVDSTPTLSLPRAFKSLTGNPYIRILHWLEIDTSKNYLYM